jgi:hypothetical protein
MHSGMMKEIHDIDDFQIIQDSLTLYLKRALCKTNLLYIDDESYLLDDEFALPTCKNDQS